MNKHTPGPWKSEYCGKDTIKVEKISDKRRIATIKVKSMEMYEANAALIAASPDLLSALKETLRALEAHLDIESKRHNISRSGICPCETNEVVRARAAIAKAEGRV